MSKYEALKKAETAARCACDACTDWRCVGMEPQPCALRGVTVSARTARQAFEQGAASLIEAAYAQLKKHCSCCDGNFHCCTLERTKDCQTAKLLESIEELMGGQQQHE